MTHDIEKYRALGVGEAIRASHFIWEEVQGIAKPVPNYIVNSIVADYDVATYLEALPQKEYYPTGAARSNSEGRGRFDLVPYEAMLSLARRYEMGSKQFGDNNWLKGQPLSRIVSSLRRHAHQINYDFTEDHAGAVLWNAAAFVTYVERIRAGILPKELDDIGYFMNEEAQRR